MRYFTEPGIYPFRLKPALRGLFTKCVSCIEHHRFSASPLLRTLASPILNPINFSHLACPMGTCTQWPPSQYKSLALKPDAGWLDCGSLAYTPSFSLSIRVLSYLFAYFRLEKCIELQTKILNKNCSRVKGVFVLYVISVLSITSRSSWMQMWHIELSLNSNQAVWFTNAFYVFWLKWHLTNRHRKCLPHTPSRKNQCFPKQTSLWIRITFSHTNSYPSRWAVYVIAELEKHPLRVTYDRFLNHSCS